MRKNPSFASRAFRLIAAASLACTVATVGCSTDRTPGAGAPQQLGPTPGPTMPSSTPGSESNAPVNPPMISSYTASPGSVAIRPVNTDAIAIAAANQSYRGRYLGTVDPGGVPSYVANPQTANYETGQFINPAQFANPEITVNRSISSEPTEVVMGDGGAGTVASGVVATPGALTTPTTAATTVSPTTAALTAARSTTAATTTTNTTAVAPVINNGGGLLTPTMTSARVASPNAAANAVANPVRSSVTTATTANTARTTSALTTANGGATGSLVIGRATNGTVTITNISTVGDRLVTTVTQPATTTPTPGLRLH